jgi:hypothetical protein
MKSHTTTVNVAWTREKLQGVTDEVVGCSALHYGATRTVRVVITRATQVGEVWQWVIGNPDDALHVPWVCHSLVNAVNSRTLKIFKSTGVEAFVSDVDAFISRCVSGVLGPWLDKCPDTRFLSVLNTPWYF